MGDYGHELVFGTFLTPAPSNPDRTVGARRPDRAGRAGPGHLPGPPLPAGVPRHLDAAVASSRPAPAGCALAANVANLPLRPPAVLARSVASLDLLSGGRVELGLGAGALLGRHRGVRRPAADPRRRASTRSGRPSRSSAASGTPRRAAAYASTASHYRVGGAHADRRPPTRSPIWLGALQATDARPDRPPRRRLAAAAAPTLAARRSCPAQRDHRRGRAAAGRAPGDVRRLYNISGPSPAAGGGFLNGPPRCGREQLAELTLTEGMSTYILASDDPDDIAGSPARWPRPSANWSRPSDGYEPGCAGSR